MITAPNPTANTRHAAVAAAVIQRGAEKSLCGFSGTASIRLIFCRIASFAAPDAVCSGFGCAPEKAPEGLSLRYCGSAAETMNSSGRSLMISENFFGFTAIPPSPDSFSGVCEDGKASFSHCPRSCQIIPKASRYRRNTNTGAQTDPAAFAAALSETPSRR